MPYYMYVAVQGDNKISVFTIDPDTGGMTLQTRCPRMTAAHSPWPSAPTAGSSTWDAGKSPNW